MTDADDDAFIDALAGRRKPHDLDTRRAARLARYFDDHPRADRAVHHDPQGEAQLIAYLRAQPPVPESAPAPPAAGPLQRLLSWLLPPGEGLGLRHAAGAAMVLGLTVGLYTLMQPGADDESTSMKGMPGVTAPAPQSSAAAPDGASQRVVVTAPQQAATELQGALSALGVMSQVSAQPDGWQLMAEVPENLRAAVAAQLDARGLLLGRDGHLAVRFVATPR